VLRSIDPDAKIIVAEPTSLRRDLAARHDATLVVDPIASDITSTVLEATANVGVDVVFDAAGSQATMDAAMNSVRANGTVVNIALYDAGVKVGIDMNNLLLKQITLLGDLRLPLLMDELSLTHSYRYDMLRERSSGCHRSCCIRQDLRS
jgi:threonine dehydrogenase-like Zn-dependent dehydrogenase